MRFAYQWHGRLGLVLAPLFAVSALSGACLLWLQPLPADEPPVAPATVATWSQALDQGLGELAQRHPGLHVSVVALPGQPGEALQVQLRGAGPAATGWVAIDAKTGSAGALRPDEDDAQAFLLSLHKHLLQQDLGPWVLRAAALLGIVGVVLGLRVWWRVHKLLPRTPLRRWHRRVGAVAALPLLVMLGSGFVLATPELARAVLAPLDPRPAAPLPQEAASPAATISAPVASLGQALAAASQALPGARPTRVYAARDGLVRVRLRGDEWNPYGMHNVYLRAADAQVQTLLRPQDLPLQTLYLNVVYPLHAGWLPGRAGAAAGVTMRLLWTGVALALVWMTLSGAWSRLRGQPRAATPRRAQK